MAAFPKTETKVNELARTMISGLQQHPQLFPSATEAMRMALDESISDFRAAIEARAQAKAAVKNTMVTKDAAQAAMEENMHKIIRAAEFDCINQPTNLEYIGWSGRKEPTPLAAPAQPRELEAFKEGPGVLTLKWLRPAGGGMPGNYKIQRSDQPAGGGIPGPWTLIATSYLINITLSDQPRGIEMQYRVIASNPAGDSMASSIATVVL